MPARTRALALVASTVLFGALAPSPGGAQEADPASADAAPVEGSPGETGATRRPVRGYLQLGWRVMGLAEHVGHGPDLGFGAVLYDVVKIGFVTFQRPGPINPSTFDYDLPEETSYCETCAAIGLVFWNHRLDADIPLNRDGRPGPADGQGGKLLTGCGWPLRRCPSLP